jgi:methylated-DNA-[protein]-cysteine S-methyltransferase
LKVKHRGKMQKPTRYVIFKTGWGYFGLAGVEGKLLRSRLPIAGYERVKSCLLKGLQNARYDKTFFKTLQEQISAYFEGSYIDFGKDIPIVLDGLSGFARDVLTECRDVRFGETISYGGLAKRVGSQGAARAVGGVMANNPLPLIIPCHRVIYSNGEIGGFGAIGGVRLKKRMLKLEQQALKTCRKTVKK